MKRKLSTIILVLTEFCACLLCGQDLVSSHTSLSDTIDLYPATFSDTIDLYPDTIDLYPATIVALHPVSGEAEQLRLEYSDQLAHDGGALLTQINGISSIRKSGAYGFDPVLRGFKYEQLNVVINGAQTASAACPNRMDPPTSQMAPNMIRRIEVLKGPYALRYGCAFGGTINFIPIPPQFSESPKVYGRLTGGYESNGNIVRSESMIGISNTWSDLGIFASWSSGDDYASGDGTLIMADFMRTSLGASLGMKLGKNHLLKLNATRNIARDVDFPALPMDLREDDTWLMSLDHEAVFNTPGLLSWKTSLYGSHVNHLMDNLGKAIDPRKVNATTLANTLNYGGRTEGSWKFDRSRLFAGMDFRMESAEGSREREFLMGPNQGMQVSDNAWQEGQILRSGLFGEYHIRAGGIHWLVSARMEIITSDALDPDPEFSALYPETHTTSLNPGISLGGTKKLSDKLSLGLWLGRAQRSAGLTERFINFFPVGQDPYEMLGNPMLDPEINNQADLNLSWKAEKTVIQLDLFAAFLQDFISSTIDTSLSTSLPDSPGVRRYCNIDRAFKTGFEAAWSQSLPAGLQHQLSLAYTYAQDLVKNEPLPEIAPLDMSYRLSGSYFNHRLSPHITLRHVLAQKRVSSEFGEKATPAFTLIDLGLTFRVHRRIGITAGVLNLLNENYYEHLTRSVRSEGSPPIYAPGRSFILSFNLDFR